MKPSETVCPFPMTPSQAHAKAITPAPSPVLDLEVKDAHLIFNAAWSELEAEFGAENLRFPKEIFWLNGAPGAGKGTNTRFIMEYRDLAAGPIMVSDLLNSPEAKKRKDAGLLVGDREVTLLVFRELLDPRYAKGVIVDGYPRSQVQVECLKLLYNKLNSLHAQHLNTSLGEVFAKPRFHIVVLFVDENESVRRQLERGNKILEHNQAVNQSGVGELEEVRKTDLQEDAARTRYRVFKESTYHSLQSLREVFHYHYINAQAPLAEVQERIISELRYQSSLELDQTTFDRLTPIALASDIAKQARQDLVRRLDDYEAKHTALFKCVVEFIQNKCLPIIRKHAISGLARINSEDALFEEPLALAMLIDIFSERGYHATVDIHKLDVPDYVDRDTFKIHCRIKKIYRLRIAFPTGHIRRGSR